MSASENELHAHIEDVHQMTIEIVTVACAGDCVQVEAVASGGNPPYTFRWDDGSTSASREVCPGASTKYSVQATDTAIDRSEFRYEAHTVSAPLAANVLTCPDGGTPPLDGSVPPGTCSTLQLDAMSAQCSSAQDTQLLGAPALQAGQSYLLRIQSMGVGSSNFDFFASSDGCSSGEALATITGYMVGTTQDICLRPSQAAAGIVYRETALPAFHPTFSISYCGSCP
ncbi:MAG TPA: hypothetical protein VHM19_13950 [Polyangiales bacterium]|nr:hypothetical protein [Polyangiales bacterium]